MMELLTLAIFCWLSFHMLKLAVKLTWCAAKVIAFGLFLLALPVLALAVLTVGGLFLLLPLAMIAGAVGILKAVAG